MAKKLYGIADAARMLGIAPSDVRACIADGTIAPATVSGRYVLDSDDIATLRDEFDEAARDETDDDESIDDEEVDDEESGN
jgi:hypothetical protein